MILGHKSKPTSDVNEVVGLAQAGDRLAFDELVRLTYAETYTLALRLTNNAEDAADVVQETYLRAYRSIGRFRGDAQFTTWLYRITANCASTQMSRRKRHFHEELDEATVLPVDVSSGPEARTDAALERRDVAAALSKLAPNLRMVLVMRDIYDLSHDAIARELNISETTAKVRLHRARKKLREQLKASVKAMGDVEAD